MFLGAQRPASRQRARLIDLNLVPAEYRPARLSLVTVGLGLLLIGSLLLLYAVFYARTYRNEEVAALASRVAQGQGVVETGANPTAIAQRQQLRGMADDFRSLKQRQINWGDVIQVIGDDPKGIVVKTVGQAGFGVTVTGSAVDASAAARYLQQLKASGLFVNASLQVNPSSNPAQFVSPTPPPVATPLGPPTPGGPVQSIAPVPTRPTGSSPGLPLGQTQPVYVPPSNPPPTFPPPTSGKSSQPAFVAPSVPSATATKKLPPTARPGTPTLAATPTLTATPTPAFDFIVVSKQQLPAANPNVGVTDIQGKIVDASGNLVPGYQVEIDSELGGAWSAQSLPNKEDGTFDFAVTHGKFKVEVLGGSSQQATDLFTGADGTPGAYGYQIVFQKTFSGTTPPDAGTGTPTNTPSPTASPTVTPIALGANVANLGCASAYEVVNGVAKTLPNGNNPNLATDGNVGTEWNAGLAPTNGTQIIWQWSLPEPGQQNPCNSPGLSDAGDQINGFELIADQNPAGPTDHELWIFSDEQCQNNLNTNNQPWITWQQTTTAGSVLPLTTTNLPVRCIIVRTLQDPSYVAWEEIQIYQAIAPPNGFPTPTATATGTGPTPTATVTAPPSATASVTGTSTLTPTITPTSTPTLAALPPFAGLNIAPYATAVDYVNANAVQQMYDCQASPTPAASSTSNPCATIDGNPSTYWAPPQGSQDPQGVTLHLLSSHYQIDKSPTPGPVVNAIQVEVEGPKTSGSEVYQVIADNTPIACSPVSAPIPTPSSGFVDQETILCPIPTPWSVVAVSVYQYGPGGSETGSFGIRDIGVYAGPVSQHPAGVTSQSASATATSSPTPCTTCAPSSTSTLTSTPTMTGTATVTATMTPSTGEGTNAVVPASQQATVFGLALPFGLGRGPGDEFALATPSPATGYPQPSAPNVVQSVPTVAITPAAVQLGAISPGQPGITVPTTPGVPAAGAFPTPLAQDTSGPVDFTIVLELAPGQGYP